MLRNHIKEVKKHVNIPVIGTGALEDIEIASDMVEKGEVDFIGIGRKVLKNPNYVEGLLEIITSEK